VRASISRSMRDIIAAHGSSQDDLAPGSAPGILDTMRDLPERTACQVVTESPRAAENLRSPRQIGVAQTAYPAA
jgi:hypothetical protein